MIGDVKILLVDDGTLSSLRLMTQLKNIGFYYIEFAVNAHCAMDYLERGHFGLVITHRVLPGMGGRDLLARIKHHEACKDLPIIMITPPLEGAEDVKHFKGKVDGFIFHPFDFKTLEKLIRHVLEKREVWCKN